MALARAHFRYPYGVRQGRSGRGRSRRSCRAVSGGRVEGRCRVSIRDMTLCREVSPAIVGLLGCGAISAGPTKGATQGRRSGLLRPLSPVSTAHFTLTATTMTVFGHSAAIEVLYRRVKDGERGRYGRARPYCSRVQATGGRQRGGLVC